jgi:hypothetical protein
MRHLLPILLATLSGCSGFLVAIGAKPPEPKEEKKTARTKMAEEAQYRDVVLDHDKGRLNHLGWCKTYVTSRVSWFERNPDYKVDPNVRPLTQEEVTAYGIQQGAARAGRACYEDRGRNGLSEFVRVPCGRPTEDWRDYNALTEKPPVLPELCKPYEEWYMIALEDGTLPD